MQFFCFSFFSIQGRTFRTPIETHLAKSAHLNDVLVEKYQSAKVFATGKASETKNCDDWKINPLKHISVGNKKIYIDHSNCFQQI